jgi:hypothetical protein
MACLAFIAREFLFFHVGLKGTSCVPVCLHRVVWRRAGLLFLLLVVLSRVGVGLREQGWWGQVVDLPLRFGVAHGDAEAVVHVVHVRRDKVGLCVQHVQAAFAFAFTAFAFTAFASGAAFAFAAAFGSAVPLALVPGGSGEELM